MLKLKIGNRRIYDYKLKIDGEMLGSGEAPALDDITAGNWMIKEDPPDVNEDALVKVSYNTLDPSSSPDFLLNTPEPGWVRIIVNSSKTSEVTPGRYYFALQLEWGAENKQEFTWGDGMIELCQDVIR